MSKILQMFGKQMVYFDGGMGTLLQSRGLAPGELPETWNIKRREDVIDIHLSYLNAGSNVIVTNTFGANRMKYGDDLEAIVSAAVENVKEAIKRSGRKDAFCALDVGPTGKLLKPLGDLEFEDAVALFADVIRIGTKAGADVILVETMNDTYEVKAAVLAAKENCSLPVFATCVFDESGKMLTGGSPDCMVSLLEGLRVDALGINCSLGPAQMKPVVERILEISSTPVIVNPNAGLPRSEGGKTVYDLAPEEFSNIMKEIAKMGAYGLGGCCGTTPEYIRQTVEATKGIKPIPLVKKEITVASSYSNAVYFGDIPVLIGERINPTGKPKLKEALKSKNFDYILSQAISQEDGGAHMLDVNVGLPEIDETEMIAEAVKRIQAVTPLPLQIDSSDPKAMEAALRLVNGKALINSVNGKKESMDAIFPLAAKYGGVIIALPLDESGIPDNAEGRIAIAERIYKEAAKYGIEKKDIIVDGLALTISADSRSALVGLDTIKGIRGLGGHTSMGVSNISFGLPARNLINSTFFTMALQVGLSCAIVNPGSQAMMDSYRSFLALSDMDPGFENFISVYSEAETDKKPAPAAGQEMSLFDAIVRGMTNPAAAAAEKALGIKSPLEIVNDDLITALNRAGDDFEKGRTYLPQLLMSAEAAQAAFEVIKKAMGEGEKTIKGRVILATVKGDIHDIGKNIVKVLLENYGYDVLDLGKDVAPETILEAAQAEDINVIGLSALMTTTVVSMEETIRLFREKRPEAKIIVGGAVLTKEYADSIGADCYSKDAMGSIRFCDEVFG